MLTQREFPDSQQAVSVVGWFPICLEASVVPAPRTACRLGVALAAVLVLFIQGFAAVSAHAAAPTVVIDVFGNPLCVAGHIASGPDDRERGATQDCCTLFCCGPGLLTGIVAQSPELPRRFVPERSAKGQPALQLLLAGDGYQPGNARAPPFGL
jgi:hypothetical protein